MTRLYNDPATFMEDMLAGFLAANRAFVTGVPGGVVRADAAFPGKVAVVVGGGSGHYPAFAGVVGPGFADGAVVGNIFTSPSADDAYHVGKAANNGGGVIITAGNYAGDVMHFTAAAERLEGEGIPARVIFVTDDIASAPADEAHKRRGIAGDFVVFKVMGAAAEAGYDLDEVIRVGAKANDRTRTLGVAFSGCTMPGASDPLFTVPAGKMGVGLGIHGEAGVSEDDLPRAADLARLFVDGVLAELPAERPLRVGAILNGLGGTKYEELFVVWGTVAELLAERGVEVVDPEVGELVTSLDMAGCSLTLVALDEELEGFWRAPAQSPAFKKGGLSTNAERRVVAADDADAGVAQDASEPSKACAARIAAALTAMQAAIIDAEEELGRIDAVAGDGDHGRGMVKGINAAVEAANAALAQGAGAASLLRAAGHAWETKAGGTSGALWGNALIALGARLGDSFDELPPTVVVEGVRDSLDTMMRLGKAHLGDKTMLDALAPFIDALEVNIGAGQPLGTAWRAAAQVATQAAQDTAALRPKVGRARPLAERSVGTPDAGAISLAMCLTVAADAVAQA